MKAVLRFLACVSFLVVLVIGIFNIQNKIIIETSFLSLRTNVGFLIFISSSLIFTGTILLLMSWGLLGGLSNKKIKKEFENTKLNYEVETEKVKQLEAKIKTLEEALKIATKDN